MSSTPQDLRQRQLFITLIASGEIAQARAIAATGVLAKKTPREPFPCESELRQLLHSSARVDHGWAQAGVELIHPAERDLSIPLSGDATSRTLLLMAARDASASMVATLLGLGANPRDVDAHSNTALIRACSVFEHERAIGSASLLLHAAPELLERANVDGNPALHFAASCSSRVLAWLLARGANPLGLDAVGRSALHHAALSAHAHSAQLLPMIDPDLQDLAGDTALHLAIASDRRAVVELLIARGADLTLKNKSGRLPEQMTIASDIGADTLSWIASERERQEIHRDAPCAPRAPRLKTL